MNELNTIEYNSIVGVGQDNNGNAYDLRQHFEKFLENLFEDRASIDNTSIVEDEDRFPVTPTILHERQKLFEEINRLRTENGKPPIEKKQVNQADTLATGHVDFFSKLRIYSVELTRDGKLHPCRFW